MGEQVSRVLVVDDDVGVGKNLSRVLRQAGYEPRHETSAAAALKAVDDGSFDLVISDIRMPGMDGIELLGELKRRDPAMPVVMITAHGSVKVAVEAMKLGAAEFVEKPFDNKELVGVVEHELEKSTPARSAPPRIPARAVNGVLGDSPQLKSCLAAVDKIAVAGTTTVLVTGESGTGKELIAKAIHDQSARSGGPFVAVNCGAIQTGLVESELFGHVKGAFTTAIKDYVGRVGLAEGGTLFLDEIGELPLDVQPKLLRLLEGREYMPVGGTQTKQADVRFVAATNRDLESMVADGTFRRDMLHRLNVFPIDLPPLRERTGDIDLLATAFVEELGRENGRPGLRFDDGGLAALRAHEFPGNVRELKNAVLRMVILVESDVIGAADVDAIIAPRPSSPGFGPLTGDGLQMALDDVKRRALEGALRVTGGNKTKAAELLGISRRTLHNWLEELGMKD